MAQAQAKTQAKPEKKSQALENYEGFKNELDQRENEIASMLPNHVSKERFLNSAIAAVKQTPGLLVATPRSLFAAVTKSAQDGLLPDGREGVITVYREKQKDNSWLDVAQWNPMTFGLRKRAREIDGIIVDAQVVYENDHFVWHQGDEPRIEHNPAPLGTARGAMIGVYAIFKTEHGILHREIMDADQIAQVREQSKNPNGIMWSKFATEAWRKTVVRRGFKSVPCSEKLQTVVQRDDDMFAFDDGPEVANIETVHVAAHPKATVVQGAKGGAKKPLPPVAGETETIETDAGEKSQDPTLYPLIDMYGETIGEFMSGDWGDQYLDGIMAAANTGVRQAVDTFIDNNADAMTQINEAGISKVMAPVEAAIKKAGEVVERNASSEEAGASEEGESQESLAITDG